MPVIEIAQEIPLDSIDQIHDGTLHSPPARQSKIRLHGRRPRIEYTDHICVLGPADPEVLLELIRQAFERADLLPFILDAEFV